ncbi:MAG: hypothetical protein ACFFAE_08915 [Candidatus Hodarchaeota archaeon]
MGEVRIVLITNYLLSKLSLKKWILLKILLGTVLLTIVVINSAAGQTPPIHPPGGENIT